MARMCPNIRALLAAILCLAASFLVAPALASDCINNVAGTQTNCAEVNAFTNASNQSVLVSATNPLPVTTTATAPAAGTAGAGYPPGATPITASATGTTAGATATLAAAAGKFTYMCGISVAPGSATTAITINVTTTGITNTFTESVGAPVTAVGVTGVAFTRTFTPCVPSSAVNTGIAIAAGALGAGGVNQDVNAWGFQQ